jgi:hypothetical protein
MVLEQLFLGLVRKSGKAEKRKPRVELEFKDNKRAIGFYKLTTKIRNLK